MKDIPQGSYNLLTEMFPKNCGGKGNLAWETVGDETCNSSVVAGCCTGFEDCPRKHWIGEGFSLQIS